MVLNLLKSDLSNIELTSTKPRKEGDRYYVHLKNKEGSKIVFQTNKLIAFSNIENGFLETTTSNIKFNEKVKNIDDILLDYVKENKEIWFPGKDISDTFLENGQMHSIRERKKSKSDFAFTLRTTEDMVMFDEHKNKISNDQGVSVGAEIVLIMELSGIWFTATRWGASWKILQMKKENSKKIVDKFLFNESESDEDEDDIQPPPGIEM